MFCHNCGKKLIGKFCSNCGTKAFEVKADGVKNHEGGEKHDMSNLQEISNETEEPKSTELVYSQITPENVTKPEIAKSWRDEVNYEKLITHPEVRGLIGKFGREAKTPISATEFLKIADLAMKPFPGVSMTSVNDLIVPIYSKMGLNTKKSAFEIINHPVNETIVRVMCSLAKNGYPLSSVEPASNGLVILGKIPSTFITQEGDLVITVEDKKPHSSVSIDARIKGQVYDWGKNKKVLGKILADLKYLSLDY